MDKIRVYANFIIQQIWLRRVFILSYIVVWFLMSLLFGSVYPLLRENAEEFTPLLEAFPEALSATFNISESFFASVEGYIGGELLAFLGVVTSITAVVLGVGSIGGQINNRVIFVYLTKPIPRTHLVVLQYINNVLTNLLTTGGVIAGLWIAFAILVPDELVDPMFLTSLLIGLSAIAIFFTAMGMLLGIVFNNSAAMMTGIAFGFASFILSGLSQIKGFPVLLKFVTPFYYIDLSSITEDFTTDTAGVTALLIVSLVFLVGALLTFRNKQVYVQ